MLISNLLLEGSSKKVIFKNIEEVLNDLKLNISSYDLNKPWGGFFVIDPLQIKAFKKMFFEEVDLDLDRNLSYSPKILLVAPQEKLSWQYHHRRSELWKLIAGKASIARSMTDQESEPKIMKIGELVSLEQGERHRLIGLDSWGIVAEIWVHTDPSNPSNEDDIVRLKDNYQRK
jgi:mannose-6-phosphate isomerase